jgi:cytochrome b561
VPTAAATAVSSSMTVRAPPAAAMRWTSTARALHWAVAALLVGQLTFGSAFGRLDLYQAADAAWYRHWIPTHKSIGLTLLLLMLARLGWRLTHPVPPLPGDLPSWQRRLATWNHRALYALVIVQAVLGLTQSSAYGATTRFWNLFRVPSIVPAAWSRPATDFVRRSAQDLHTAVAMLLALLIALHVTAALYHQFVRHDGVLGRMLPGLNAKRRVSGGAA